MADSGSSQTSPPPGEEATVPPGPSGPRSARSGPDLVGQRLGADRPDLAERSTYTGLKWTFGYMAVVAAVYLTVPGLIVSIFEGGRSPEEFAAVAALVPTLLVCVAVYSLADAVNLSFAFALRGAGDTWFVTLATFGLAWPIMVLPTFLVVRAGGSVLHPCLRSMVVRAHSGSGRSGPGWPSPEVDATSSPAGSCR